MNQRHASRARSRAALATSSLAVAQLPCLLFLFLIARAGAAGEVAVDIEGLEGDPEKNVRLTLGIVAAEGDLTAGQVERLHARAPEEIAFALEPFGYYRPTINGTLTEPEPGHFAARYVIVPGPQVHLRKVEVGLTGPGEGDSELQEAVADFPLAPGDVLFHAGYESGKNTIAFAAADNGYFDAAFDSTAILVDRDSALADIVIQFSTGPRYRFGPAELQQDILDPRVLGSYITFEEGEPYEVEKLLDLQSGLSASPYFSRVEAKPMPERANGLEVPIEVALEPRKTQRFDVGVGYGTDTGVRGSLDVELRRLNRRGHRAEGSIKISQIEMSGSARYVMPSLHPSDAVYSFFAGYAHLEPETSESDQWVFGGNVSHRRWGWQETLALSYELEDFTVGSDAGRSHLLLPALTWERTRADNRIFTRRGSRLRFDVKGAHDAVLSSTSLLQLRGDAKVIRPVGERMRVLARAGAGRVFADDFHALPATLRFFVGGDQSVRGFEYKSISPRDSFGNKIGGQVALEGSLEAEVMLLEKWGVAFFYDAGNSLTPSSALTLEQGTGAGIRWLSPIGLVRVDGAYAIGSRNLVRLHIGIGPDL